jgi:hypothetical protein
MNGEVSLIVRVEAAGGPGNTVIDTTGGYTEFGTYTIFMLGDMTVYIGHYVQITSTLTGVIGTFELATATYDGTTWSTVTFVGWTPIEVESLTYQIYSLASASQEYYLDLFENESISQNWKFQDLNNFTAQGSFSREFRVPFSATNQLALGALFDVNVESGASNYFHYKLPAEIRVDTLPIATGYVRVRKVYKQLGRVNEVELAFYAETPDLVRNIGEKKLEDIFELESLNETINYANITNPSADRIWTILDRGQRWSEGGEAETRSLITPSAPVWPADLTPALNWWFLFSNIIKATGFELVAGSLQSILETYWMPWVNTQRLIASDSFNDLFFLAEQNTLQLLSGGDIMVANTEVFDNANDYNAAAYTYTTPADGFYTFQATLQISPQTSGGGDIIIIVGLLIDGILFPSLATTTIIANSPNVTERVFTFRIGINAASSVQLHVENALGLSQVCYYTGSWGLIATELHYGQTMLYGLNAPDMKQIDFVTDVIKMHNCAIVADKAVPSRIYIVPQNSYLGTGNVLNWTDKLDISKDITIGSTVDLQKGKFQFTYTAGEDIISRQYKNVQRVYGDYEAVGYTVNPDILPSDFAIGDQKITLVTRSTPSGVVKGSGYVMPMFLNDSVEFVSPGPRCLFEAGSVNVQLFKDSTATVLNTPVAVLNNYSQVYAEIDDEDLNWAPETPPHPISTNPYNNLFNRYWRTYMNALYSPEARMMEASFALSLRDILTFQFSDKVWIQDSYWRILEVTDYKVGNLESTKVKLLKFLEDTEDCASTPVTVSTNGEVNFEDAGGNPVAPTQDCCTRYGYTWDETAGVCWAFVTTGNRPNSPTSGSSTNPAPRRTKAQTRNATIIDSVINGDTVAITLGNKNMLAVGENLDLTKDVGGNIMLGKNVTTNLPGMHVGGGYRDGDPTSIYYGWAQFGTFVLQSRPTITTSGDVVDLDIEGVAGEYINMPDDTLWSVLMNVTIKDATGVSETSLLHFTLEKIGGLSAASAITTISTIGAIGANVFTFGIDTATNTDEHRINVTATGGTYPDNFFITASIQYQQSKTT